MWENAIIYKIAGIVIAGALMIILGKVNEKKKLHPGSKLIFQILISLIIIYAGIKIEFLRNPATPGSYIYFSFLSIPLTLIWVIAITNSIGQTDELGDITPYIVFIASLTFFTVALLQGQALILAEILSLSLAVVSFIVIKFFPRGKFSSFYMLFGFILAIIAIVGVSKSTAALTLFIPLLILGVPLIDSSYSIVSNYALQQGKEDYFYNNESKLRRKLQSYGFSSRGANLTIIATSIFLSVSALIISIYQSFYLLVVLTAFGWLFFELLKKEVKSEELIIERDITTNRLKLFQVGIDRIDIKNAVSRIEEFIISQKSHLVVTPDTLAILRAQKDFEYYNLINSANLVTPDGAGILWAAAALRDPLPERVTGIDIIQGVCELAVQKGYSIYLLGASPGIAQEASLKLLKKYPGLKIAGHHHGYFNAESLEHSDNLKNSEVSDNNSNISNNNSSSSIQKTKETNINCNQEKEEAEIIQEIKDKKPDILLVGMGVPRQEKWISRNLESKQLNVPVCMGVGGSFDVLSGKISRAPFWMQKHGMEWIYRLIKQPKRAFHTLALFYFMGLVIAGKIILTLKNTD